MKQINITIQKNIKKQYPTIENLLLIKKMKLVPTTGRVCFIKLKDYNNAICMLKVAISYQEKVNIIFNLAYCYAMLRKIKSPT